MTQTPPKFAAIARRRNGRAKHRPKGKNESRRRRIGVYVMRYVYMALRAYIFYISIPFVVHYTRLD